MGECVRCRGGVQVRDSNLKPRPKETDFNTNILINNCLLIDGRRRYCEFIDYISWSFRLLSLRISFVLFKYH